LSPRSLLSNANTILNYGKLKRRYKRFESFVNDDMKLSGKFYSTNEELRKNPPEYDIYVCGSDQIWNPLIYKENAFDPAFFAEFAKAGKKAAYAPSFGIDAIPGDKREQLKRYLDSFERLSVREKQGEKIIKEISGRKAVTVLDPTLLLTGEDWSGYSADPSYKRPYLLCYFITDGRKYSGYVKALSEKLGLPVISLCGSRRVVSVTEKAVLDAGPREFLGLFKNASFVCTDSFHGTVFSINFKRNFYCFESAQKAEKAVNSRLHNILEKLGLLSRIFPQPMDMEEFNKRASGAAEAIDYTEVDRLLVKEREMSLDYLREAITL
jgi:hypothetical protein